MAPLSDERLTGDRRARDGDQYPEVRRNETTQCEEPLEER